MAKSETWLQISVLTKKDKAELVENILMLFGAEAITLKEFGDQAEDIFVQELGETPLWQQLAVVGLFVPGTDKEKLLTNLTENLPATDYNEIVINTLADENWELSWMQHFKPIQFTKDLWVCPYGQTPPKPKATNIILNPGLAFGTGTHPTTAMCLKWLARQKLKNKTVIDYGCGSGILAIAAAKLGAREVYCVDNDMQALLATKDNAVLNDLESEKIITLLPEDMPKIKADILVANILAKPLLQLESNFFGLLKENAKIALSGILTMQQQEISLAYKHNFDLSDCVTNDDWCMLAGTSKIQVLTNV